MALIDRIRRALEEDAISPDKFERAACAMLRERYPWLSPVEGGTDLGRDADVYRALPGEPQSRGRLLATTGDPMANFRRSRARWVEEGLRVDQIVIVCSRPMGGKTRRSIERECAKHGLPLPEFYGRDWVVSALVTNPDWREFLIGVKGRLEALTPRPFGAAQPEIALAGRDETLRVIQERAAIGADFLLVGKPGVGKTRLLLELGAAVQFVEPLAATHLADDLLATAPRLVVVDDAHLHLDILVEVARLRVQEGLRFGIVAATWPDGAADVAEILRDAAPVVIELLPLEQMDVIVQAAGVTGVHARELILRQAEGRPGWALALCNTLVDGGGVKVVSGEALLDHVVRYVRQASDSLVTMDVLACIAALKWCSAEDLERIAQLVGSPFALVSDSIRRLATNGLVERGNAGWGLQPSLRAPLIGRWFFGGVAPRPWGSLVTAFPERRDDLTFSLLEAATLDPSGPSGLEASRWASGLPEPSDWDEPTMALVMAYSRVSERAAAFASGGANEVLAAPRELQMMPWGTPFDPLGIAAHGILRSCVQRWFSAEGVHGLLTLAVGDGRPRAQTTEHPMRILHQMAMHIDPDGGAIFETRPLLLRYAIAWLRSSDPDDERWRVACEAMRYAFTPAIEGTWSEPGHIHTISFASGTEGAERLAALAELWHEVEELLGSDSDAGPPPKAVIELLSLLEEWIRVAGGISGGAQPLDSAQRAAGAVGARAIYRTIHPLAVKESGLALRTWRLLELAHRRNVNVLDDLPPVQVDEDLLLLVGRREVGVDVEVWMRQRDEDAIKLAQRVAKLGPAEGSTYFAELIRHSGLAGNNDDGRAVASHIARIVDDRESWLECATAARQPALVYSLIVEARIAGHPIKSQHIPGCLAEPRVRVATIRAVVEGSELDEVAQRVVAELGPDDAWVLEGLFVKSAPDDILLALLTHECREVRAMAAVSFAIGDDHGPDLPPGWQKEWENAFLDADRDSVTGHSRYRLEELLKKLATADPAQCRRWFEARLRDSPAMSWSLGIEDLGHVAAGLPSEHREFLARLCFVDPMRGSSLLRYVLGHDADLASRLIEEGIMTPNQGRGALSGERDAGARILIPVLVKHGLQPEAIAQHVCMSGSWAGDESAAIQGDIDWFEELRRDVPEAGAVCAVAIEHLRRGRSRALEEERRESIRGWH